MDFDKEQKKAIEHIDGPFLCIAGPGSGKTTVIVNRTLNLIKHGIDPNSILVMTFSNNAAGENKKRYETLPGSVPGPHFSTIHSFALTVCRDVYHFTNDNILTASEQLKYIKAFLRDSDCLNLKISFDDIVKISKIMTTEMSRYRFTPSKERKDFTSDTLSSEDFTKFYNGYTQYKRTLKKIDFDDMIANCILAFENKDVLNKYQDIFKYIMVDEFQDTSVIQAKLIYKLADKYKNLFVCGDDDQSIYGFRNACPDLIINFPNDYKGCGIARISTNYRSDKDIINCAGNLIVNNKNRFEKHIVGNKTESGKVKAYHEKTEKQQLDDIIKMINSFSFSEPLKEIAILGRTNHELSGFAMRLSKENIPFWCKDNLDNIHNTWVFRIMYSYAKIAYGRETPEDIMSIVNKPSRYLNGAFVKRCNGNLDKMVKEAMYGSNAEKRGVKLLSRDINYIKTISGDAPFYKNFEYICTFIDIPAAIEDYCQYAKLDVETYMDIYNEILIEADDEDFVTFDNYNSYIKAQNQKFTQDMGEKDPEGVVISTMHSAKGQEYDIVIIPNCNLGNIPHLSRDEKEQMKLGLNILPQKEEERRLFYVGITRARKMCIITDTDKSEISPYVKETAIEVSKDTFENDKELYKPEINDKIYRDNKQEDFAAYEITEKKENISKKVPDNEAEPKTSAIRPQIIDPFVTANPWMISICNGDLSDADPFSVSA